MARQRTQQSCFIFALSLAAFVCLAPISAAAAPQPLTPRVEAFPSSGPAPLTVVFTGRKTTGKWGGITDIDKWEWDFDYDGKTFRPDASYDHDATVAYTYDAPGTHVCRLRVTDTPNTGQQRQAFLDTTVKVGEPVTGQATKYPPGLWGAGINHVWANDQQIAAAKGLVQPVDQIYMTWAEVEPNAPGTYDWSRLDKGLTSAAAAGDRVSVQINSTLPTWMFDHVASTGTARGELSPQFWDPIYIKYYEDLITALGDHIAKSPDRDRVLYVRQQWNAVHTESTYYDNVSGTAMGTWVNNPNWVWATDGHQYQVPWSASIAIDYEREIAKRYIDTFAPLDIGIALRAIESHLPEAEWLAFYQDRAPTSWSLITNNNYMTWQDGTQHTWEFVLMRGYGAAGYEETWNDSAHRIAHFYPNLTTQEDVYGTVLRALQIGLPYIGIYGSDLALASSDDEVRAAFEFADRYAGWHHFPATAPGAWIVLGRFEGDTTWKKLHTLTQDNWGYFLRQNDPAGNTTPVTLQGDTHCRFSLVGRELHGNASFDLDDTFAASTRGTTVTVEVVQLDGSGDLAVQVDRDGALSAAKLTSTTTDSDFDVLHYTVDDARFSGGPDGHTDLVLVPKSGTPVVHRVQVLRVDAPVPVATDGGVSSPDGGAPSAGGASGTPSTRESSGCGCQTVGGTGPGSFALLFGVALLLARRRAKGRANRD